MGKLMNMDTDNSGDISWNEKSFWQKVGDTASFGIADAVRDNRLRLENIEKAQQDALNSEWNTSKVTPQMLDAYNKWNQEYSQMKAAEKYGLSDAEKNLAIQQNTQGQNLAQMNALRAGGNGGAYINSVLNAQNNQFGLNLAATDAELQRQKRMQTLQALEGLNRSAGVFQDSNNLNFQKQTMTEQALGQAQSDWYANRAANNRALLGLAGSAIGATASIASAGGFGGSSGGSTGGAASGIGSSE